MEKRDPGPSICVQFRDLWKGDFIWKRNLVCAHLAIACFIVSYFGMLLNAKSFGRDRLQINTMLMGMAEISGVFIGAYFIMNKGKYKFRYVAIFNLIGAAISMSAWLVPTTSKCICQKLFLNKMKPFFFVCSSRTTTSFILSLHFISTENGNLFGTNHPNDLWHRSGNTGQKTYCWTFDIVLHENIPNVNSILGSAIDFWSTHSTNMFCYTVNSRCNCMPTNTSTLITKIGTNFLENNFIFNFVFFCCGVI